MAHSISSLTEGLSAVPEKARDAAHEIADRVEDALDTATVEGRRMGRKVKKELGKRWVVVDRAGRDNAFVMALGALSIGILVGYLMGRDK